MANLGLNPAEHQLLNVENPIYPITVTSWERVQIVTVVSVALAGLAITSTFQAWQLRLLSASVITAGMGYRCSVWRAAVLSKNKRRMEATVEKSMKRSKQAIRTLFCEYEKKYKWVERYRPIHNENRAYFLGKLKDPKIPEIGARYAIEGAETLSPQQEVILRIVHMVEEVFWTAEFPRVAELPNDYKVDASLESGKESEALMLQADRVFVFRVTSVAVAIILLCALPDLSVTTSYQLSSLVVVVLGFAMHFTPFAPMPYEKVYLATLERVRQFRQAVDAQEPCVERLIFTGEGEVDVAATHANCRAILEASIETLKVEFPDVEAVIDEIKKIICVPTEG